MGVTKQQYFEMCAALNSEPIDSEIPIDFNDLYLDVQQALGIYGKLRDEWDTMNGNYLGKNMSGILDIFQIMEVSKDDRADIFNLIIVIDKVRIKILADKKPKNSSSK